MEENEFWSLPYHAIRLCSLSVKRNEKVQQMLSDYYNNLTKEEQKAFEEKADKYWDLVSNYDNKCKISVNAIMAAYKIKKQCGYSCFPILETVARKGWSTSDGTFSWSIPLLMSEGIYREIDCFDPASWCSLKNIKMNISLYQRTFLLLDIEKVKK